MHKTRGEIIVEVPKSALVPVVPSKLRLIKKKLILISDHYLKITQRLNNHFIQKSETLMVHPTFPFRNCPNHALNFKKGAIRRLKPTRKKAREHQCHLNSGKYSATTETKV